jgi:hypothetical protein
VTDLNNVLCFLAHNRLIASTVDSQVKLKVSYVTTDGQSACLGVKHPSGAQNQIFITVSCGFVDVGRPLSREGGSVIYNCCCPSPAQLFSGPSPPGLVTIFYCLRMETPPAWRARSTYLYPQEQGGPVTPPCTVFPFHRLLRLAGLRWSFSNPPPRGSSVYSHLNVLLITSRHGSHRKHRSSITISSCCRENKLVCEAVTQ